MAKIEFIDLTDSSWQLPSEEQEYQNLPELSNIERAILKHCWSLDYEIKKKLSGYFLVQSTISEFYKHVEEDNRYNERLIIGDNKFYINYMNLNSNYLQNRVEDRETKLLISARINWKSNFYECLVRYSWELTEEQSTKIRKLG